MALNNFFRINLPYGIAKNESGDWMAFNREYMPLGYNDYDFQEGTPGQHYLDKPIYTKYKGLTEKLLMKLAHGVSEGNGIKRDENNNITKVFLYNDATNPTRGKANDTELWDRYFERLKILSKLEKKNSTK